MKSQPKLDIDQLLRIARRSFQLSADIAHKQGARDASLLFAHLVKECERHLQIKGDVPNTHFEPELDAARRMARIRKNRLWFFWVMEHDCPDPVLSDLAAAKLCVLDTDLPEKLKRLLTRYELFQQHVERLRKLKDQDRQQLSADKKPRVKRPSTKRAA